LSPSILLAMSTLLIAWRASLSNSKAVTIWCAALSVRAALSVPRMKIRQPPA
jgi:hypothetical protein